MDRKSIIKESIKDKYKCLECDNIKGLDVLSFGDDNEPYVLNFQVDDDTVNVNIIDKDRKSVIDNYSESFEDEDELRDKIKDASVAYDLVISAKPVVEKKIESKEAAAERDEIIFHIGEIGKNCMNFFNKYDHDYNEDDVDFDTDLNNVLSNIDINKSDISKNFKLIYENKDSDMNDSESSTDEINNNTDIDEILNSADVTELLEIATNKLRQQSESEDDEVISRILDDIAMQTEDLLDELSSAVIE